MTESDTALLGRILVIDDEFGPRESLRFLFKDDYEVQCCDSVDSGVAALKEDPPDVIILDIKMPGKNGIEGLGEIRDVDADISVIMLTGFGNLETAQKAIRLGANDYIRKPFDTKQMRETVARYIDRTRVTRRRVQMTRDIESLNDHLEAQLADAKHYASLGEASAEFVHDLRNPLTVISGYVQLLLQDLQKSAPEGDSEALEYLGLIDRNVSRCQEMSEMWRVLGQKDALDRRQIAVAELVRDAGRDAEQLARDRKVSVEVDQGPEDLSVEGDLLQLTRAIQNLISNAMEALPSDAGRVALSCRRDGDTAEIVVEDNGHGIPHEQLENLFSRHFTTKSEHGGLGVGLLITQKAVSVHGGELTLTNREGGGVSAVIRIPALRV